MTEFHTGILDRGGLCSGHACVRKYAILEILRLVWGGGGGGGGFQSEVVPPFPFHCMKPCSLRVWDKQTIVLSTLTNAAAARLEYEVDKCGNLVIAALRRWQLTKLILTQKELVQDEHKPTNNYTHN